MTLIVLQNYIVCGLFTFLKSRIDYANHGNAVNSLISGHPRELKKVSVGS